MNEYPDSELVNLVCERSEEASDVLYDIAAVSQNPTKTSKTRA